MPFQSNLNPIIIAQMEQTLQEDQKTLESLIKNTCERKHPGSSLPDRPWFYYNRLVQETLMKILQESEFKTAVFAQRTAAEINQALKEKASFDERKAAFLRENLDIRNEHA